MLKISIPNGYLKLASETEIPLTITNPLFNDRGSYSLPFSVPLQPNRTILGFPDSHNNKRFVGEFIDCTIEHGVFKEKGTLKILDITENEVELSLTTREGAFWEWAKETPLRSIETPSNRYFNIEYSFVDYFDQIWPAVDMAFFPVAVNKYDDNPIEAEVDYDDSVYYGENEYLIKNFYVLNNPQYLNRTNLQPIRRGVTGFLYLNEVLRWILNNYGVRFGVNEFNDVPEMNRCVVLNSATNPFRDNQTHLNELLPSGSVLKFIDAVEKTFSCMFFYNSINRTLNLRFLKNIYSVNSVVDINGKIKKFQSFSAGKQLNLKSSIISSDNAKTNDELTEESIRNTEYFIEEERPLREHGKVYLNQENRDIVNYPDRFVFNIPTQCYFLLKWEKDESDQNWLYRAEVILSRYSDYAPVSNLEKKEYESKATFTPMVKVDFVQYFMRNENEAARFNYSMLLPHFNVKKQEHQSEIFDDYVYKTNVETPISFAFYRGKKRIFLPVIYEARNPIVWYSVYEQVEYRNASLFDIPWGSTDVFTQKGEKINGDIKDQPNLIDANIALRWHGEFGLFDNYKILEQLLRYGLKEAELYTPERDKILTNPIYTVYRADECFFLINEMELTLKLNRVITDKISVLLLKLYT